MGKKINYREIKDKIDIKEYFKKVTYKSVNGQLSLAYGYYQDDYDDGLCYDDYSQDYYQYDNFNTNNDVDDYLDSIDESAIYDEKTIYYYIPKLDGIGKAVHIFHNLSEFDRFLDTYGISVADGDVYNYVFYDVIHCCLDPIKLSSGVKEMISDVSLDGLEYMIGLTE